MMKTIILTQDYEIFFGKESGTVNNCMIIPNKELMQILRKYDSTMTVFWDVLHYNALNRNLKRHPELQSDILLIESQIQQLVKENHDIQLHIHSHWLDAKYVGNHKWYFSYNRYSLHDLDSNSDPNNINTIIGCIKTSVDILKKFRGNNESAIVFRAGGYHLEPFHKLIDSFKSNSIFIDSSNIGFPKEVEKDSSPFYRFATTPSIGNPQGEFIEFPIASIKLPIIRKLWFKYLKRRLNDVKIFGDGKSIFGSITDSKILNEQFFVKRLSRFDRILKFVSQRDEILTPESNFKEKFNYLVKKAPDFSVMTLHPKYLTVLQLDMIEELLRLKKIRFISISDYKKKEIIL